MNGVIEVLTCFLWFCGVHSQFAAGAADDIKKKPKVKFSLQHSPIAGQTQQKIAFKLN